MTTTTEALTLGGLISMRMPRDAEECRLTIRMENPGGLTAHQTVDVVSAQFGFDWEARQLVLTPSRPMSALSAQDLDDLRKSARAGQSWHAYQQHKRHSDEKDALKARLAAVEAERDQHRAELEALRADAERYRWLRSAAHDWGICQWDRSECEWVRDSRGATVIDNAVDAARGLNSHV